MGGLFGPVAYLSTLDRRWLLGATVQLANWPYTIFIIMPTNRRLMDTLPEAATAETRRMIEGWVTLHAGRSALGLVATLNFLWAQREHSNLPLFVKRYDVLGDGPKPIGKFFVRHVL